MARSSINLLFSDVLGPQWEFPWVVGYCNVLDLYVNHYSFLGGWAEDIILLLSLPFEPWAIPQFHGVSTSPYSCVSHSNFSNPLRLNPLSPLYSPVGGVLIMTKSLTCVWDYPNQGFKWLSGSMILFSLVKSVIISGTHPFDVGGLLDNLCLMPI